MLVGQVWYGHFEVGHNFWEFKRAIIIYCSTSIFEEKGKFDQRLRKRHTLLIWYPLVAVLTAYQPSRCLKRIWSHLHFQEEFEFVDIQRRNTDTLINIFSRQAKVFLVLAQVYHIFYHCSFKFRLGCSVPRWVKSSSQYITTGWRIFFKYKCHVTAIKLIHPSYLCSQLTPLNFL